MKRLPRLGRTESLKAHFDAGLTSGSIPKQAPSEKTKGLCRWTRKVPHENYSH